MTSYLCEIASQMASQVRKRSSKVLRVTFFSSALSGLLLFTGFAAADERPNILQVMADDLGWSDIGAYGGEIDTPRLDELAAQGTLFTDFHASVSCSPTRAMLMSGNDNHIAGLGTMSEMLVDNRDAKHIDNGSMPLRHKRVW